MSSDLKLFRITKDTVTEMVGAAVALEKSLQSLIERNMEAMFGTRFIASEHSTGVKHGGRIDSLGLDENGSPVIFEFKRAVNENVINQGLFYLDWLVDHRAEFQLLTLDRYGSEVSKSIDWRTPRLVCIASDFTKYDVHAVSQMGRSIELVRYSMFEGELIALELIAAARTPAGTSVDAPSPAGAQGTSSGKTVSEYLAQAPVELADLYAELEAYIEALGDDVTKKTLKLYFAFRRLKNFACIEVHPQSQNLLIYLKVDPTTVTLEPGFSRDVRSIGHFGTGDLELRVSDRIQLEKAFPLIQRSYEES